MCPWLSCLHVGPCPWRVADRPAAATRALWPPCAAHAQALSKRIHFGKYVAEAKFRAQTDKYSALIRAQDSDGLMALLTDLAVEERVVARVGLKVRRSMGPQLARPARVRTRALCAPAA